MNLVRVNGVALHVAQLAPDGGRAGEVAGTAHRTAVLIHGMTTDTLASWYFTLAWPLAELGFRVVMYDLRGHGKSERPATGYALDDFVDDLAGLLGELGITGPVHLVGNSFGGTVAFGYAARQPQRVAAVVAIESSLPTEEWFVRMGRRLRRATDRLGYPHALARIRARRGPRAEGRAVAARDLLVATTVAEELPASRLPPPEQLAAIGCPVLCIYGGASRVGDLAPAVHALLPQARTVVVPGQGHSVLVDRPAQVIRLVVPWLSEQIRSGSPATS